MSEQQSVFEILDQSELERGPRVKALYELGFTWADLEDEEYWLDAIAVMRRDTYKELEEWRKTNQLADSLGWLP